MTSAWLRRAWLALLLAGCGGEDLQECDLDAAEEYVFSPAGVVATKGQALIHDSCGQSVFCHSAAARGGARMGAPAGLNFDMLPEPIGLGAVLSYREQIWGSVVDGEMPPEGHPPVDSDWTFDPERREGDERLPQLDTKEGKSALRNWLACGAPIVADTTVPEWARPAPEPEAPEAEDPASWSAIHRDILQPGCGASGCHDGSASALPLADSALPLAAEPCITYRWLLWEHSNCGEMPALVAAGDPDTSFLLAKLSANPPCGEAMPPKDTLPTLSADDLERITTWIMRGAHAPECGQWSELVARRPELQDPGTPSTETPTSWGELHAELIAPRCGIGPCHGSQGAAMAGHLDLSEACAARDALLGEQGPCELPRVVPGDPGGSLLIDKISSSAPACGQPMPPGNPLAPSEIAALRAWIESGAEAPECD